MGSSKPEKKMKKTKKRSRELVENGETARDACSFGNDVAGSDVKACQSQKARKSKHKPSLSEPNIVVNNEPKSKPDVCSFDNDVAGSDMKACKSKKARKSKIKDKPLSSEPSIVVNDGLKSKPDACSIDTAVGGSDMKAHKSKKARRDKSKDKTLSSEASIVVTDKLTSKPKAEVSLKAEKGKSKKAHRKEDPLPNTKNTSVKEVQEGALAPPDVYQISLEEEDDSKGIKKWMKEYQERRPGLKILQERIDDFISAHEEQEEQAKREKEDKLIEEGWTVVVHRKGGKRTTDPESGVAVGSVAEAAVRDKLTKKKNKDIGLDFYRFQRKEAHRSELMKLQSKFEEDKKRIQQIRAARKFKPY